MSARYVFVQPVGHRNRKARRAAAAAATRAEVRALRAARHPCSKCGELRRVNTDGGCACTVADYFAMPVAGGRRHGMTSTFADVDSGRYTSRLADPRE